MSAASDTAAWVSWRRVVAPPGAGQAIDPETSTTASARVGRSLSLHSEAVFATAAESTRVYAPTLGDGLPAPVVRNPAWVSAVSAAPLSSTRAKLVIVEAIALRREESAVIRTG